MIKKIRETVVVCDGSPLRLSFSPTAIREHFSCSKAVQALSDETLAQVAAVALNGDILYSTFHQVLALGLESEAGLTEEQIEADDIDEEDEETAAARPRFYTQQNIGAVKYVVNHHDGKKTHPDGSPFFDIATFNNKRNWGRFVAELRRKGYVEAGRADR